MGESVETDILLALGLLTEIDGGTLTNITTLAKEFNVNVTRKAVQQMMEQGSKDGYVLQKKDIFELLNEKKVRGNLKKQETKCRKTGSPVCPKLKSLDSGSAKSTQSCSSSSNDDDGGKASTRSEDETPHYIG